MQLPMEQRCMLPRDACCRDLHAAFHVMDQLTAEMNQSELQHCTHDSAAQSMRRPTVESAQWRHTMP